MAKAIRPRHERISMCTSQPMPDGGVMLTLADAETYRAFEANNGPWDYAPELGSKGMMQLVRCHGIAVSQEIFDTINLGIPFKTKELIGELQTLECLAPKTQYCIIDATLRWLSIQEEPQARRVSHHWWML